MCFPSVTVATRCPRNTPIGGAGRNDTWSRIEQFVVSTPQTFDGQGTVKYTAYVDSAGLMKYPASEYVHAKIPLAILVDVLKLADARSIASLHGISAGSRCSVALLKRHVNDHSCKCAEYLTIFFSEKKDLSKRTDRTRRYRMKTSTRKDSSTSKASNAPTSSVSLDPTSNVPTFLALQGSTSQVTTPPPPTPFPPDPASKRQELAIIRRACGRMDPKNFEEVGCAVCGELKPRKNCSRLKSVKNLLGILEAPGVTRVQRKNDKCSIKEYRGPVLDYSCSSVCDACRKDLRNGKVPRLALARNLWLGSVPDVLKNLTFVEKILIARVRHTCAFVKVASGMRKMKANIVAFESPVQKIYNILPPPKEDIQEVLAILFTGPCKPTQKDLARTPFLVRRNAVIHALEWLRLNHADYSDIQISHENAMQYSEDMPPVSIEYRESITNKVPEGTSVFDQEEEDGTLEGDCAFTVHGLTGENFSTMTPSALKAAALRHLNSGGKMLAVGHSDKFESMWNNPQLYPQMFPWLFPYGLGGIGAGSISHKEHKRHLLMYHDKRFQVDVNFPFVAFSHEQVRTSTTQSYLLVEQSRFAEISRRLMSTDQAILGDLINRMDSGEQVSPTTDAEKVCFQLIHDLDAISGKMYGSTTSKKYMRNEIWSLVNHLGAPSWYITLSPADILHPICIYFADTKEEFCPTLPTYDERIRLVCQNPVAGARFFDFMVRTFLSDVLGIVTDSREGFYGPTSGYYGTVEQQGRLTLHMHMLLWIAGNLNPEDLRAKILGEDSKWRQSLIDWLERCHSGDFFTGTHAEITARCEQLKTDGNFVDPTQSLPVPPPSLCEVHSEKDQHDCKQCHSSSQWIKDYETITDDLLLRSNVHSCNRGTKKDGTRKKIKTYAGCMDNKWGTCKARFPRQIVPESVIDETGAITMKKTEAWINTFTPLVTYLFRCNTDVTSLASGTAIKGVIMYVSDYITKSTLKTHVIFDSIRTIFQRTGEMMGGTLPAKEKARRFMTKVANLLSAKAEMGSPMICMYLLGNPDHYTDHQFIPFYWQQYVQEARRDFAEGGLDTAPPQKVAIIKRKGRIVGLSPVHDYVYRPSQLDGICLYDWVRCYERVKLSNRPRRTKEKSDVDEAESGCEHGSNISNVTEATIPLVDDLESDEAESTLRKGQRGPLRFESGHPLRDSHGIRYVKQNIRRVPNFLGANLPRCDQGDREYYCATMSVLFKPWRCGSDLKNTAQSWDDAFQNFEFTPQQIRYMRNFNVRYECLDARDDYRAQMKKGIPLAGSWDADNGAEVDDEMIGTGAVDMELDDLPSDPLASGPVHKRRVHDMSVVRQVMSTMGWTHPGDCVQPFSTSFKPDVFKPGNAWEQEIEVMKQKIIDEKNSNRIPTEQKSEERGDHCTPNVVKIVDKSYLDRNFHKNGCSELVDSVVKRFSLNRDQERSFRIIANHSISDQPEQLRMYLGGMGGTGKTQVIKALTHFFALRKEAHRFIVVAPTGTAAALLSGSTYHSMFGINDRSGTSKIGHIKAKLTGVEYVFFDEVSMLSARDMYRINLQLARVFDVADVPFGGLNMVFSGDFAQLPPAVGGEHVSLYSRKIGAIATDIKSQEESVGKALWHQVTTVVILRENMRQRKQTPDDAKLRTALENMRFKACTPDDIAFLRTRISSQAGIPGKASVCDDEFRNVSIITGTNVHKDEINRLGAIRFAQETGQTLTDFFSEDSPRVTRSDPDEARGVKRVPVLTKDMMEGFWSQPPSSTDKHIAGKLSLCIGLPVMIRYNYATEMCMTRGQEGFVYGWQSKIGSLGQTVLDTLFVKLKDPPSCIQIPGLPENVVPVFPTTTNVKVMLPNDEKYYIARTQVEVLVNYAMTDFASQGKTRPFNVADLNNLRSHQSYYTALSRSATAAGTLILQGFDPKQIVGGCSGALRQEFRELELLDEITRLRYSSKLPVHVDSGNTRNSIIASFRAWKGCKYVPSTVHRSIRWSAHSPWLESENLGLDDRLASLVKANLEKRTKDKHAVKPEKLTSAVRTVTEIRQPNAQKRRRSSGLPMRVVSATSMQKANKQRTDRPTNVLCGRNYVTPIGMRWSQNSCAYDSVFTPIFVQWCADRRSWTAALKRWGTDVVIQLVEGFVRFETELDTLEGARDAVRRTLARSQRGCAYGAYTSIENVCAALFRMKEIVSMNFSLCPNGHHVHLRDEYEAFLSAGASSFASIARWVSMDSEQSTMRCTVCHHIASIRLKFCRAPPLLAFDFSGRSINLDYKVSIKVGNIDHTYALAAVIYYAYNHFTSQIITRDGAVWFYDGLSLVDMSGEPTLEYVGSINNPSFSLQHCRGGTPSAAMYCRVDMASSRRQSLVPDPL